MIKLTVVLCIILLGCIYVVDRSITEASDRLNDIMDNIKEGDTCPLDDNRTCK